MTTLNKFTKALSMAWKGRNDISQCHLW